MSDRLLFVHNTFNRTNPMYEGIRRERARCFGARFVVLYNNPDLPIDAAVAEHILFENPGHYLGCFNAAWKALELLVESECEALVFSHDDTVLHSWGLLRLSLETLRHYDFVGRDWQRRGFGVPVVPFECFVINKRGARFLLDYWSESEQRTREIRRMVKVDSEAGFGKFVHPLKNKFLIPMRENLRSCCNEMGYFHTDFATGSTQLPGLCPHPYADGRGGNA